MSHSSPYHFTEKQIIAEQVIIEQAKKNTADFAPLYNHYHEQIYMFILKRVETMEIADDITSQVFMKALINLPKYVHQQLPFASWLYRIARNEIFNLFEKNKIQWVVSIDKEGIINMLTELKEENLDDELQKMNRALRKLKGEDLELIEMRFFEQRSFKEIGDVLNITENNAKVKTYRILEKLKSMMINEK